MIMKLAQVAAGCRCGGSGAFPDEPLATWKKLCPGAKAQCFRHVGMSGLKPGPIAETKATASSVRSKEFRISSKWRIVRRPTSAAEAALQILHLRARLKPCP